MKGWDLSVQSINLWVKGTNISVQNTPSRLIYTYFSVLNVDPLDLYRDFQVQSIYLMSKVQIYQSKLPTPNYKVCVSRSKA